MAKSSVYLWQYDVPVGDYIRFRHNSKNRKTVLKFCKKYFNTEAEDAYLRFIGIATESWRDF